MKYDVATDTFSSGYAVPGPANRLGHSYDHNAANTTTGESYYRIYSGSDIYTYDQSTDSWSTTAIPTAQGGSSHDICYGIEWNTARGTLQIFDAARGDLVEWDGSSTWGTVSTGLSGLSYCPWMEYNPVDQVMCFGDGTGMYCSTSGGVTSSKTGPSYVMNEHDDQVVADPVSGNLIVHDQPSNSWEEYDYATDSWSAITHSMPPISTDADPTTASVSIPEYGVIAFLNQPSGTIIGDGGLYIYKHTESNTESAVGAAGVSMSGVNQ